MLPQSQPAREFLEAALRIRHLDRTLTTRLPAFDPYDESAIAPTGISALDRLGGGFPRGQLSEIVGARSSGRTSVLLHMIAMTTAHGELAALIDALDMFDVGSALAAGIDLEHLLWIRGRIAPNAGGSERNDRAIEQAIKALTLVLRAGNFGLVAFDLGEAPVEVLHRLPSTTWLRVQRMVEGSQTVCVLVGSHLMARSAAGLTLRLGRQGVGSVVTPRFGLRTFEGLDVEARVIRARARGQEGAVAMLSTTVSPHA